MKSIDHTLWEHELAEYISLHPDLDNLPPPVFPRRRSRLARRLWRLRQSWKLRRAQRSRRRYLLIVITLVFESILLSAIIGWWLGWHL